MVVDIYYHYLFFRRRKRQIFNDNNLGFNSAFTREEFTDSLQSVDVSSLLGSVAPTLETECEEFGTTCDISTPFRYIIKICVFVLMMTHIA